MFKRFICALEMFLFTYLVSSTNLVPPYLTLFKLRSQRHRIANEDGIDVDFNVDVIQPSNKFCQQLKQLFGRLCEYTYVSSKTMTQTVTF